MTLGLRGILLIVAIVLFVVAAISDGDTAFNVLCIGLAPALQVRSSSRSSAASASTSATRGARSSTSP